MIGNMRKILLTILFLLVFSCEDGEQKPRELSQITSATDVEKPSPNKVSVEVGSLDTDGDGVLDGDDLFPNDRLEWSDSDLDGTGDNSDVDDDNDGLIDEFDPAPFDANNEPSEGVDVELDSDRDGLSNLKELELGTNPALMDTDGDGLKDGLDQCPIDPTSIVKKSYYEDLDEDLYGDKTKFIGDFCEFERPSKGVGNNSDANDDDPIETVDLDGDGYGRGRDFDDNKKHISIVDPMSMTFNIDTDATTVTLPLVSGFDYKFTVDWGDGTVGEVTAHDDDDKTHTYVTAGYYTVELDGLMESINFGSGGSTTKYLHTVGNLGAVGWLSLGSAFKGASNLVLVQGGDTSHVTSMDSAFANAKFAYIDTSTWNTSNVTNMNYLFSENRKGNPEVNHFDVRNTTNFYGMFYKTYHAIPDVEDWQFKDTVIDLRLMFSGAVKANPDLSKWRAKSFNMQQIFEGAVRANPVLPFAAPEENKTVDLSGNRMFRYTRVAKTPISSYIIPLDDGAQNEKGLNKLSVSSLYEFYHESRFLEDVELNFKVSEGYTQADNLYLVNMYRAFRLTEHSKPRLTLDAPPDVYPKVSDLREAFDRARRANPDLSIFDYSVLGNGRITDVLESTDVSKGNLSKFLLRLVDPVYGSQLDSQNLGLVSPSALVCGPQGDFDVTSAVANLTDTGVSPNSWTLPTLYMVPCADTDADGTENIDDLDIDGDGISNDLDTDDDGDGLLDTAELLSGTYPYYPDSDFDGVPDSADALPLNPYDSVDADADGTGATFDVNDAVAGAMPFISVWRTTTDGESITLPLIADLGLNITVDWGDGSSDVISDASDVAKTHTYITAGEYTVRITGTLPRFAFANAGDKDKIISIPYLGDLGFVDLEFAFQGCQNLEFVGQGDFSAVGNLDNAFAAAPKVTFDSSHWDLSSVSSMMSTFEQARVANPQTAGWNVSNVTSMRGMFREMSAANPTTGSWNVSNVSDMASMFYQSRSADPDVGSWDVSNVTTFAYSFYEAYKARLNLENWNVANATDFSQMFRKMTNFTGDLKNWNTANVQNMTYMFSGTQTEDLDLKNWDVRNVEDLSHMFSDSFVRSADMTGWDTSKVTTLRNTFRSAIGLKPITTGWNTSNVQDMRETFAFAFSAESDVSGWNTSNVTTMYMLFREAHSIDPDVSNWQTSNVTNIYQAFHNLRNLNTDFSGWDFSGIGGGNQSSSFWNLSFGNTSRLLNAVFATKPSQANIGIASRSYCISPPHLDASAAVAGLGWSFTGLAVQCVDDDMDGVEAREDLDDNDPTKGYRR